jgi:hypothetical protein
LRLIAAPKEATIPTTRLPADTPPPAGALLAEVLLAETLLAENLLAGPLPPGIAEAGM